MDVGHHQGASVERLLQGSIGEQVELVSKLKPNLANIKADPSQIEQVLLNLAANARDAMPEGGRLTIDVGERFLEQGSAASPGVPVLRVLETGDWPDRAEGGFDFKKVSGGLLVQNTDLGRITADDLKVVTNNRPTAGQIKDMLFAWTVVKYVKSNAIIFCKDGMTIGVGAGQMSRVYSTKIAAIKAADEGLEVQGSVMASDAFFPFRDGIDAAAETGIAAIIQPGGSMRDEEAIAAANEHGMAMVFTGMRHFRH